MNTHINCIDSVQVTRRSFLKGIPVVTAGAVAMPTVAKASVPVDGC